MKDGRLCSKCELLWQRDISVRRLVPIEGDKYHGELALCFDAECPNKAMTTPIEEPAEEDVGKMDIIAWLRSGGPTAIDPTGFDRAAAEIASLRQRLEEVEAGWQCAFNAGIAHQERAEVLTQQLDEARKALRNLLKWPTSPDMQDKARAALSATPIARSGCQHEWVDARNSAIKSGEVCLKCYSIRAASDEEVAPSPSNFPVDTAPE